MVSLVRLERYSLDWSELLLLKSLDLGSEDNFRWLGGVHARSLDGDHEVSSVLDELSSVESEDTGLIWLGHIGEDHVNHWHEHSVFLWMSSVFNDWDDIGSLLGHVDQVSSRSLRELDSVDAASWTNEVSNMGDGSS